ncbi:NAD(P)-binding protein [Lentinus tigrinus ALCF2SS1-7]|uniref:NAD(P)-binding protein n=1 Tax=Lentinus tigrinus ALCF2SS1-6 TaxID=1328759 RepID=A0A5C2SNU8_9APHY|nr:NAD(P)-binding protein [Lentinus tigrinus ALCF2SS1-6]RPD81807.1 NAD(P)-binding protein [Lentinus tigrinus ALCF2SS1-7]
MPAVMPGKVLVTGANGYVAIWVVKAFLEKGFAVRGTVRSQSKAKHLRQLFQSHGDKFEVVIVDDITKDGAFDDAVKGVDAIAHTASPFHMHADDPNEMIIPALQGTLSVLHSALKYGKGIKRIVITASCATVLEYGPEPRVFSEKDWNERSIREVNEKGRAAAPGDKYCASKILAERAAWDFHKQHKNEIAWDVTVLNPPFVFGPVLHEVDKPENLNQSVKVWWDAVVAGQFSNEDLANNGDVWVDVRDLATAHVLAITTPEAGGERVIVCSGPFKWQDFVNVAHRLYPKLPAGNTSYDPTKAVHMLSYDTTKERKLFGIKFHTLEEMTKDTLEDFVKRGWVSV